MLAARLLLLLRPRLVPFCCFGLSAPEIDKMYHPCAEPLPKASGWETSHDCLDELLGTVAHELRSPLATVLTGVSVISSECDLDPFARRTLKIIERQLQQGMRLVDDLFDMRAGGLGKLSLRKEMIDLGEVVARAVETTGRLLETRRHRLTVSLPPEPLYLEADPSRLEQVLTNLLCNAAKFTDPGGDIRLSVAAEAGQIVLRVRDNGRGIAPELLPRVFELFHQISGQGTGGLGIGLALVKSLVERHGGSVSARSEGPGTGSEFIVRLPDCADGAARS